ncbi:hypothetical protein N1851_026003 [Merluccius polli]|uniref:Uncharacterized protein n=1 Tax=Merluccius polli TaxID=89951 RepID=A0AA47MCY6_MERPO|nr:hypothetical protein N1851_026003 [Merluccius polli]
MVRSKALDRLQYVQNSAARNLNHTKPWRHITLIHLHWLQSSPASPNVKSQMSSSVQADGTFHTGAVPRLCLQITQK